MRDMTVTRAARHGTKTEPIPHGNPAPTKPELTPITPDEWATILQLARTQRTEEAITAYGRRTA